MKFGWEIIRNMHKLLVRVLGGKYEDNLTKENLLLTQKAKVTAFPYFGRP